MGELALNKEGDESTELNEFMEFRGALSSFICKTYSLNSYIP